MNQMWLSRLLFPDYCPPSPTEQSPTAAQSVAGVHPIKDLLQHMRMRNETAHAQYTTRAYVKRRGPRRKGVKYGCNSL